MALFFIAGSSDDDFLDSPYLLLPLSECSVDLRRILRSSFCSVANLFGLFDRSSSLDLLSEVMRRYLLIRMPPWELSFECSDVRFFVLRTMWFDAIWCSFGSLM